MRVRFVVATVAAFLMAPEARAEFVGKLAFTPKGCEASGKCKIATDFKYIDPNKIGWLTKANDITDGASIPTWAQPFVGKPFEKKYLKAAVIHDHYCDRHVRPWRQTHKVFYDALRESGVDEPLAKLLYFAVYLGGPKWVELIPGNSCGPGCEWMQAAASLSEPSWSQTKQDNENGERRPRNLMVKRSEYDNPRFAFEVAEVHKLLKDRNSAIGLAELEERAKRIKPDDFYYTHNNAVSMTELSTSK